MITFPKIPENQDVPKTVKEATTAVSSYTNSNLTRDTTCTCTFKFNDISILSKTFKIYEASKFKSIKDETFRVFKKMMLLSRKCSSCRFEVQ